MASEQFRGKFHPNIAHMDFFSAQEVERAERLHAIKRFGSIEKMTHRTSDFEHELRTAKHSMIFSRILLELSVGVDLEQVLFFADHHDDVEMETGDTPAPKKDLPPQRREHGWSKMKGIARKKLIDWYKNHWGFVLFL